MAPASSDGSSLLLALHGRLGIFELYPEKYVMLIVSKLPAEQVQPASVLGFGLDPNTDYLEGIAPLDHDLQIIVNDRMETQIPYLFAAGDIRSGSPRQIATAVGDGAAAAVSVFRFLKEISSISPNP